MAIRKPIKPVKAKKMPGVFTKFKLSLRKKLAHSPAKRAEYKRQLARVEEQLKEAKKAA